MKLFEYSETFAQLFDSFDAICGYEPEQNENDNGKQKKQKDRVKPFPYSSLVPVLIV